MEYNNMVKIYKIIFIITLFILLSYSVFAFGVSSPYWDENPLYLKPGETKEVTMILQNMVGEDDIKMTGELNSGSEIAVLINPGIIYDVPLGSNNVPVNLRITVPEDAKPGKEWQVGVLFKTIADNTGGVGISGGISKGFKVIVKEEQEVSSEASRTEGKQTLTQFIILLVILIVLGLIIKYFYKGKHNKNDR